MKRKGSIIAGLVGVSLTTAHGFSLDLVSPVSGADFPEKFSVPFRSGDFPLISDDPSASIQRVHFVESEATAALTPDLALEKGADLFNRDDSSQKLPYQIVFEGDQATVIHFNATAIPEPTVAVLGLLGFTGLLIKRRRP